MRIHRIRYVIFFTGATCIFFLFCFLFFSCSNTPNPSDTNKNDSLNINKEKITPVSELEKRLINSGLVDVHNLDTSIAVEIKYSSTDNFMHRDVYGDFDKAYLQKDVAEKLVMAQKYLNKINKGYRLIIYDAVRPKSIQQYMWDSSGISYYDKIKYLANPVYGSLHNYGCAVDLSILDDKGKALDMGTPYDYMGIGAGSENETALLKDGKFSRKQIDNRKLLRKVMEHAGFYNVQTEWWHYNACNIEVAKKKYKIVE